MHKRGMAWYLAHTKKFLFNWMMTGHVAIKLLGGIVTSSSLKLESCFSRMVKDLMAELSFEKRGKILLKNAVKSGSSFMIVEFN